MPLVLHRPWYIYKYTHIHAETKSTIMTNVCSFVIIVDFVIFFLIKIYLSHFIRKGYERVMCERWVGDWTNCNILTPSSSVFSITSSQPRLLKPPPPLLGTGSHCLNCNKLTPTDWTSCRTGLYHCLTLTCFLWASHLHPIQPSTVKVIPWYLRPDAPVPWLTAGSKVNMLQLARISQTLCRHAFLSSIVSDRSSRLHIVWAAGDRF